MHRNSAREASGSQSCTCRMTLASATLLDVCEVCPVRIPSMACASSATRVTFTALGAPIQADHYRSNLDGT